MATARPYVKGGRVGSVSTAGFTSTQKAVGIALFALVGPSLFKTWFNKPAAEKVDLSAYNLVTHYDVPAIEKRDSTLRIEFCAS